jgi:hypothetical protein
MDSDPQTLIVCSCDQRYVPLLKGLVLSITEDEPLPPGVALAFLDAGCESDSHAWLRARGVRVRELDAKVMGPLANPALGYQRAQFCRPFLPDLFPAAKSFIWLDCDTWVQDTSIFASLCQQLRAEENEWIIAPECHYSYTPLLEKPEERRQELLAYYEPTFGAAVAASLQERVTLNSGFFAVSARHPIWREWRTTLTSLHLEDRTRYAPAVRHMAEQIALNVAAARVGGVRWLDPLYNYLCLWTPPFRDEEGIVRVSLPPYVPVGVVHLAGGWKFFGERYAAAGLLYQSGDYLTSSDWNLLFSPRSAASFR